MGKYLLVICAILCFAVAGVAVAQEKAKDPQKSESSPPPEPKIRSGEITSIDAAKNDVVIKDETGAEIHLMIGTSTKIIKAGKAVTLADLKVGDKLSAECDDSATACKAKTIAVTPPGEG